MPGKITHPRSKISGNEGGFKKFRIGDYFEKQSLGRINKTFKKSEDVSTERSSIYNLPLVNAKHGNNGIQFYGRQKEWHSTEMAIDVVSNGAVATGDVYAQPQRTGVLWDAYLIKYFASLQNINQNHLFYFASSIRKSIKLKFSYDNKAGWEKVKNEYMTLPTTKKGNIDFSYMEQYIDELQHQQHNKIENFLKSVGLDNCELTKKEKTSLCKFNNQQIEFKQFDIVEKFDVKNSQNNLKSDVVFESGDIPYVTASEGNNSVVSRISCADNLKESGNSIMIGGKTLVVTYQPEDFVSNDSHNLILYLKDSAKRIENIQLFCVCTLNHFLKPFYSWGDSISKTKIQKDVFSLPVTPQGAIDYDFMETFISAQKKLVAQKVVHWLKQQQINDNILEIERNLPKDTLPMVADKGRRN